MLRLVLIPLFVGCMLKLTAQPKVPYPKAEATLHVNRVRVNGVFPGGVKPDYFNQPFVVDFDGNIKPIAGFYGVGLWIGGLDTSGQDRVACVKDSRYFSSGIFQDDWPSDSLGNLRWDRIFSIRRVDLEAHRADWADNGKIDNPRPDILAWPGRGNPHFKSQVGFTLPKKHLAPFMDENGDGIYNPFDGDYPHPSGLDPDIIPGQILWNIYNDVYGFLQDAPLRVEVQATAWALSCDGDNLLNESVFFSHKITNKSGLPINSATVGFLLYKRLGAGYSSDHWGTYVSGNSVFVYNNYHTDMSPHDDPRTWFGPNPPVASFTFLNQSLAHSMYMLDEGTCDPENGRLGPATPFHYNLYLNGRWRDTKPLTYGGTGYMYDGSGTPTDFAFPDDPNNPNGWSLQQTEGYNWGTCMKILPSVYFGTLPPDTTIVLETAYSYHRGPGLDHLQNVTYCYERIGQLQALYDNHFSGSCTYTPCTDDCVWPGDLDRDGIVRVRDILPLGIGWAATGEKRTEPVTWAPHHADNWGVAFDNSYDFKHIDGNGDGALDSLDQFLVQAFLGNQTPTYTPSPDEYLPDGRFWLRNFDLFSNSVNPNNVLPNRIAYIHLRVLEPGIIGFAFDIDVDTSYWTITETTINKPTPGLELVENRVDRVEVAAVFTDKNQILSPNYVYFRLNLQSKAIPDSLPDTTFVRLLNVRGIRPDGSEVVLGSNELRYCFGGNCPTYVGTAEPRQEPVTVFPNPTNGLVTLLAPDLNWQRIEAFDLSGRCIRHWDEPGNDSVELDLSSMPKGWVLLRVSGQNWVGVARVLVGF